MCFSSVGLLSIFVGLALLFLPVHPTNDLPSSTNGSARSSSTNPSSPPNTQILSFTIGIAEAITFVQEYDSFSRQNFFTRNAFAAHEPSYQKEVNKIMLILSDNPTMHSRAFIQFMNRLQQMIDQMNTKLSEQRHFADIDCDQVLARLKEGDIKPFEYNHPNEKFNIIERIFEVQFITICRFFLDRFLDENNQDKLRKIITALEIKENVFDLERYERKRKQFNLILESSHKLIGKKLAFFDQNIKNAEKNYNNSSLYKINYTEKDYKESIEKIEKELSKIQFKWLEKEGPTNKMAQLFWTTDFRPIVQQTLWVIRHAEKAKKSELGELAPTHEGPLSKEGEEQAEKLRKWFQKVPITKVFASPFQQTLQTATLLLGEAHPGTFVNIEPGLGEILPPCDVIVDFKPLSELYKDFPQTNPDYWPVYSKRALELIKRERLERGESYERQCHFKVEKTVQRILAENRNAEHIVLVTHSDAIGDINKVLGNEWATVDTATVSKYVQYTGQNHFVVEYSGMYIN